METKIMHAGGPSGKGVINFIELQLMGLKKPKLRKPFIRNANQVTETY